MMSRRRYWVVGLLGLVSVITFLDRMAIAVVGPLVQQDLKLSPQAWSWVLNAYVIAYGLFEIPSGALGDRNGQRRELTRIATWWSAFTALTAWCGSLWQLFAVRFLFGMGAAGAYPNITGVLWRWLPARERARGQGVVWGASRLGGALAPAILVPIALAWGWRAVFGVLAALGIAWAVAWWLWYHDQPAEQPGMTQAELAEIGTEHSGRLHSAVPWRRLLSLRQLWLLVAAYGFYAWGSWFFYNWFPTWMVRGAHFSNREMGVYASLPFLLGMVSNIAGGYLCDWLRIARWEHSARLSDHYLQLSGGDQCAAGRDEPGEQSARHCRLCHGQFCGHGSDVAGRLGDVYVDRWGLRRNRFRCHEHRRAGRRISLHARFRIYRQRHR